MSYSCRSLGLFIPQLSILSKPHTPKLRHLKPVCIEVFLPKYANHYLVVYFSAEHISNDGLASFEWKNADKPRSFSWMPLCHLLPQWLPLFNQSHAAFSITSLGAVSGHVTPAGVLQMWLSQSMWLPFQYLIYWSEGNRIYMLWYGWQRPVDILNCKQMTWTHGWDKRCFQPSEVYIHAGGSASQGRANLFLFLSSSSSSVR